jgi:hypothetical protein
MNRVKAFDLVEKLKALGYTEAFILQHVIGNYLPAHVALEALEDLYETYEDGQEI